MWVGQLNVRCMSGNWIASVCRLCARAPNYRPTILLSCFTSIYMLVDSIRGLCCVPIRKELLSFACNIVCGFSFVGETVNTKAGACDPLVFAWKFHALFEMVNKLLAEISVAEMLCRWLEVILVPISTFVSGQKMTVETLSVPNFLVFAGIWLGLAVIYECYLVDPASSHMLVSKIKPCMCKYERIQTVKLRMAH